MTDDGRVGLSTDSHLGLQKWLLDHNQCLFAGESDPGADVSVSTDGRVALLSIPEGESVGVVWPPPAEPAAPWSYARPGSATRLIEDARTADTIMNRAAVLLDSGRHGDAWSASSPQLRGLNSRADSELCPANRSCGEPCRPYG
ncbi:hypothetical protein ACFRFL_40345 [Streptomyces sp. NPDC056708]|uniref:hypothetical protein n=1 Tax=unclassified Streptomyces TaxID=2593676 RepID=UPI0036AA8215